MASPVRSKHKARTERECAEGSRRGGTRWRRWASERGESGFEGHGIVMEKCAGVEGGKNGAMRTCHRRAKVGRRHYGGRRRCKVEGG